MIANDKGLADMLRQAADAIDDNRGIGVGICLLTSDGKWSTMSGWAPNNGLPLLGTVEVLRSDIVKAMDKEKAMQEPLQ